jgi:hypothetical protein
MFVHQPGRRYTVSIAYALFSRPPIPFSSHANKRTYACTHMVQFPVTRDILRNSGENIVYISQNVSQQRLHETTTYNLTTASPLTQFDVEAGWIIRDLG